MKIMLLVIGRRRKVFVDKLFVVFGKIAMTETYNLCLSVIKVYLFFLLFFLLTVKNFFNRHFNLISRKDRRRVPHINIDN